MNVSKKFLYSLLFGLFIAFGFIFNSADTYATTYTQSVNAAPTTNEVNICDHIDCSSFSYVEMTNASSFVGQCNIRFSVFAGGSTYAINFYPTLFNNQLYNSFVGNGTISKIVYSYVQACGDSWSNNASATFTFYDDPYTPGLSPSGSINITSNGSFDVSTYATAVVNVPTEENSQFMGVVIDSFWQYHVAFASASVGIIVIFLVYRIIKGRLR